MKTEGPKAIDITLTTAPNPGAIAIFQLCGPGIETLLAELTGINCWPTDQLRYVQFSDIDDGCAVCLRRGPHGWAQLMPHGGPRVVQKLADDLLRRGCQWSGDVSARCSYPEARNDLEADALAVLARAASPAAIDLLLAQPDLWSRAMRSPLEPETILHRSDVLDRLIEPPSVLVCGAANVGKSTLANRLAGRSVSVVADMPGTTRDWVAGLVEIRAAASEAGGAVVVRWLDTPGVRQSDDPIEARAIELARRVVSSADVRIAMCDKTSGWPDPCVMPGSPHLWLLNKMDDGDAGGDGLGPESPLHISALNGHGLERLRNLVLARLGLDSIEPVPWAFSPELRTAVESEDFTWLRSYMR